MIGGITWKCRSRGDKYRFNSQDNSETYPDLTEEEVEQVRQHVVVDSVIKNNTIETR
jgi:hypothetical protein